jgi:hypothetical protein
MDLFRSNHFSLKTSADLDNTRSQFCQYFSHSTPNIGYYKRLSYQFDPQTHWTFSVKKLVLLETPKIKSKSNLLALILSIKTEVFKLCNEVLQPLTKKKI